MNENLRVVLASVVEVFGLVAIAFVYARRLRPDLASALRLTVDFFLPCLIFTSILDARIAAPEVRTLVLGTGIQIALGLGLGAIGLRFAGRGGRRELLLPIAFVNSANLPFPLVLANFGPEGLARAVVCYLVTSVSIYSIGVMLLHGHSNARAALREPTIWAAALALVLRFLRADVPEVALRVPRLAATAAVPLMLVLFGDTLARAKLTSFRDAALATALRYGTGLVALACTLKFLAPEGVVRQVLVLYALLPSAVINVILVRRAERDPESVASAVLLASLLSVAILPLVLAFLR